MKYTYLRRFTRYEFLKFRIFLTAKFYNYRIFYQTKITQIFIKQASFTFIMSNDVMSLWIQHSTGTLLKIYRLFLYVPIFEHGHEWVKEKETDKKWFKGQKRNYYYMDDLQINCFFRQLLILNHKRRLSVFHVHVIHRLSLWLTCSLLRSLCPCQAPLCTARKPFATHIHGLPTNLTRCSVTANGTTESCDQSVHAVLCVLTTCVVVFWPLSRQ